MNPPPLPNLTGEVPESPRVAVLQERRSREAFWTGMVSNLLGSVAAAMLLLIIYYRPAYALRTDKIFGDIGLLSIAGGIGGMIAFVLGLFSHKTRRGQQALWSPFPCLAIVLCAYLVTQIWPPK